MKQIRVFSVTAALLVIATTAQAQRRQNEGRAEQGQRGQTHPQDQQRHGDDNRVHAAAPTQGNDDRRREQHVDAQRVDQQRAEHQRVDQQRIEQQHAEEQRDLQRRTQLDRERELQLRQHDQQQDIERARERVVLGRAYDGDRYDGRGYNYRYNLGGVYRETNQYGADALRQAVDRGYQEGYRAGLVDLRGRRPANFQQAFDFGGNNFGYTGTYVPQGDYTYYLREGFQRGYDDAYGNRARYGTFYNGNPSILGDVAAGILGLALIR